MQVQFKTFRENTNKDIHELRGKKLLKSKKAHVSEQNSGDNSGKSTLKKTEIQKKNQI